MKKYTLASETSADYQLVWQAQQQMQLLNDFRALMMMKARRQASESMVHT